MDIYRHDASFRKDGCRLIAGIDEAGRGPLAGPVVASAVILSETAVIPGLRDSKKIPAKEREAVFLEVLAQSAYIGVGIIDHTAIDRYNVLEATKLAMMQAVRDLATVPDLLLIDAVKLNGLRIPQLSIIRADAKSAAVAAASVVAKQVRDGIMLHYDSLFPEYLFRKHKGYGTREHITLLRINGPSPIHRKTFRTVAEPGLPLQTDPE